MIEFSNCRRNPAASTLFVNKIAGIYRVSPSTLKVIYALATGPADVSEVGSLLWQDGDLDESRRTLNCRHGTFGLDEGLRRIWAN
jgi:hypothetical protein